MESGVRTNIDNNVDQTQPQRHDLAVPRIDQQGWAVSDDGTRSVHEDQPSITQENPVDKDSASICSLYSYKSFRDRQHYIKLTNGRQFGTMNTQYLLPADSKEYEREDHLHSALVLAMGGLYPYPEVVHEILRPSGGTPKRILDIGCGSGTWAFEMALRFPLALVLGVDTVPSSLDTDAFPPNLTFEVDDVNLHLNHFHGDKGFDLIHMRMTQSGIKNIDTMLIDLQHCLKPGGLLIIIDMPPYLWDQSRNVIPMARLPIDDDTDTDALSKTGSWLARFLFEANEASCRAGIDTSYHHDVIDEGLWDGGLLNTSTASSGSLYLPIGPNGLCKENQDHSEKLHYIGALMRRAFMGICDAYRPRLLDLGIPDQMLDEWHQNIVNELTNGQWEYSIRVQFCLAMRTSDSNVHNFNPSLMGGAGTCSDHLPLIETFHTATNALSDMETRDSMCYEPPESAVERMCNPIEAVA